MLARVPRTFLFVGYLAAITAVVVFALLEIPAVNAWLAPDLPYYALRRAFSPDSVLVFTPAFRGEPHRMQFRFRGDLYSPAFGVPVDPIDVDITYAATGFRTNTSAPPYAIAVIGDSYVDLSETDENSFSERLAARSGRSTLNLGTAWYGPYQYVELMRRTAAIDPAPDVALFMFYAGNDIADIVEYERWLDGGRYHGQDRRYWDPSVARRFATVSGQVVRRIRTELSGAGRRSAESAADGTHPDLAFVALGDSLVPMAPGMPAADADAEALLKSEPWRTLRRLLEDFRTIGNGNGMTPVVVYIPTKLETYAEQIDATSGRDVLAALPAQRAYATSQSHALAATAGAVGLCFIDLLPHFRALAGAGELLYHPFDTHWNEQGRSAGAEIVANALAGCEAGTEPDR